MSQRERTQKRLVKVLADLAKKIAMTDAIIAKIHGPIPKVKVEIKTRLFNDPKPHAIIAWLRSMKTPAANRMADMIANATSSFVSRMVSEAEDFFGKVPEQWLDAATKEWNNRNKTTPQEQAIQIPHCPNCGERWGVSVNSSSFECRNPTCARDGAPWRFDLNTTSRPAVGRNSWPVMEREPGREVVKRVE